MKITSLLLFSLILTITRCTGQNNENTGKSGEFKKFSSGLIYSDTTMSQLKFIVDSLNLKFRTCEMNKTFLAKYQARGHYFSLSKGKIKEARKDLENNISFEDFVKKYPASTIDKDLLIVKSRYKNYYDKEVIEIASIPTNERYGYEFDFEESPEIYEKQVKNSWIIRYNNKNEYTDESVSGFYFETEFEKQPLAEKYARMVQYSECMVDTSTQIFKESARRTGVRYDRKSQGKVEKFLSYIHKQTKRPEYDEKNYDGYIAKYKLWDSTKYSVIENTLLKEDKFKKMLSEGVAEALENGSSNDEFEDYVTKYYSTKTALELKRGRIVVGGCSMDNSPRVHAMNIAVLSAETVNWETFLRAHLDIMNDRFERVSDGSWAWAGRKTYIKELEELDINVPDLMLGITLRVENPGQNHYYGSINRLGRALAETRNAKEIEDKMLGMIKDNSLDDYNRMLIYFLFINYNYNIQDESRKKQNQENLKTAVSQMPQYLASRIKLE